MAESPDPDAAEAGADPAQFTVSRNAGTATALTVYYTVGGTATGGEDYAALSSSVVIPAGATSAVIDIDPIEDAFGEGDETVVITLLAAADYFVGSARSAAVTIADDEVAVWIEASGPAAYEKNEQAGTFTVRRSGDTTDALTVSYAVSGTATAGPDYAALPGTVTISAGASSAMIPVNPLQDNDFEPDETVVVTVDASTEYDIGAASSATVTIYDRRSIIIDFDDLPAWTELTDQYGMALFSGEPGFPVRIVPSTDASQPNSIGAGTPSGSQYVNPYNHSTYVDFPLPVNDLSFVQLRNDDQSGQIAEVRVFENGAYAGTTSLVGTGSVFTPVTVDLSAFEDVTRIEIVNITDAAGLIWDDFQFVINEPPVAQLDGPTLLDVGEYLELDASASSDPDGNALTFHWDVDGDGTYETDTGSDSTLSLAYWDDGLYDAGFRAGEDVTIGLRVLDSQNKADETSITVHVADAPSGLSISERPLPPLSGPSEFYVFDDSPVGTFIGTVVPASGLEPPASFTVTGGSGSGLFSLTSDGDVYLASGLDPQASSSYVLTITGSNGSASSSFSMTLFVAIPPSLPPAPASEQPIDFGFIFPETASSGSTVGEITVDVGGVPADSYVIQSGNEAGLFAIDDNGTITVTQAPASLPETSYVLEVVGIDSSTGNGTIATVAFFAEAALAFAGEGAGRYDAETVIEELGGKKIRPTKFGDLPLKLQLALNNPGTMRIVMHDTRGTYLVADSTQGTVIQLKGPKALSNPQVQWELKLDAVEGEHRGTIYYELFGLKDFFKELKQATADLQFQPNSDPEANAIFSPSGGGTIYVNDIASTNPDTVVHESVHALDFKNGWYLPNLLRIEKIEALGWTTQHMVTILKRFKDLETKLKEAETVSNPQRLNDSWYRVIQGLNSLYSDDIAWQRSSVTPLETRNVKNDDIQDVMDKLRLNFAVSTLMSRYQQEANNRGISYTFRLRDVAMENSKPLNVPTIFRR